MYLYIIIIIYTHTQVGRYIKCNIILYNMSSTLCASRPDRPPAASGLRAAGPLRGCIVI